MNKALFATATALGAIAIIWMGAGFIASDPLALSVTAVIAFVYLLGIAELVQFRRGTATLAAALEDVPTHGPLDSWIARLDSSLRNAVRVRIEGERVGLPAPIFSPYLVGLLVMLGLLGTFVGMVETLQGAVMALEGSTELEAIRAGLAAPIQGLGLAFGTSVAGVAASAMLGLNATLSRRERMLATRQLDNAIAGPLREHSLDHQRRETYRAMQSQAQALPEVAQQLGTLSESLQKTGENLAQTLVDNQRTFQEQAQASYSALAESVDQSLRESLANSAQLSGESIKPVLEKTMADIADQAGEAHQALTRVVDQQLAQINESLSTTSLDIKGSMLEAVQAQEAANQSLLENVGSTQQEFGKSFTELSHKLVEAMRSSSQDLTSGAQSSSQELLSRISSLLQTSEELITARQQTEADWLEGQKDRMTELATVIQGELSPLQEQLSGNIERDSQLLQERQAAMAQLDTLAQSLAENTGGQKDAIEQLVSSSSNLLEGVSTRINDHIGGQVDKVSTVAVDVAGSAAEVASLAEALGVAVSLFSDSSEKLTNSLQSIEQSLDNSSERSDEQLAYYVAQAREIIDQSMLSQREIIEEIRQLGSGDLFTAEAS